MKFEPNSTNISLQPFGDEDRQAELTLLRDLVKDLRESNKRQFRQIEILNTINARQSKEIEQLKSEIRRLKELKTKPKFRTNSKMDNDDHDPGNPGCIGKRPGSEKRNKRETLIIHKTEIIKIKDVPVGSKFKGYREYVVQGIAIKTENTLFKLENWQMPNGSYKTAELPEGIKGHHFSPELRAYILHQYHHQEVTQPLLLSQLKEWDIDISKGQLNRILVESKEIFHIDKEGILSSGLSVSRYIQTDDTGARHAGRNGYCTHIGNDLFAWFESTNSKSRINFLTLLRQGHSDYVINEDALAYMKKQRLAPKYLKMLCSGEVFFTNIVSWKEYLERLGMLSSARLERIATEGAMIGALLHHGFRKDIVILSDDAGQFNVFEHALCWVHAERKINELIGFSDNHLKAIEGVRKQFWDIYDALKAYKKAPHLEAKQAIHEKFEALCTTRTCYGVLNLVLKRMKGNKNELLLVLERPEIPLHNNLSERDIRNYVKKRKISGSTRSDAGRRCRDTFTSLKKTCKKLGVRFWDYLNDRLTGANVIPTLSMLIKEKALAVC